jgi:transposase
MATTMTSAEMAKRIEALEQTVDRLADQLEYQQAVEGIRRGLESAARSEGISWSKARSHLAQLQKTASQR